MSKLILISYSNEMRANGAVIPEYKKSMKAQYGEKVFIFGKPSSATYDNTNKDIVMKHFGMAKTLKRNAMAINHTSNISGVGKGAIDFNKQRLVAIESLNDSVAKFFLEKLHELTWDDYNAGILSTIPFDEAFELLVPAMKMLYEILAAGVEDKYSQDLSIAEMKNALDKHNLLIDQTLGKNVPNKSKRKNSDE